MEEDVDPYLALSDPEGSLWPPVLKSLAATLRTFNVRQPFSMLLAARRRFQDAEFEAIFRAIVAASFRYNVIGNLGTSEQERAYSQGAIRLARGEADTVTKALALLAPIYPDDATFKASFAEKTIRTTEPRNRRVVRYILCAIEKHLSGTDHDFASQSFNIEHILPQNPEAGWDQFTDEQAEAMVYRLGNMTLMETGPNRDSGNEPFGPKKAKYAESVFSITKKVAEDNAEWNPERIAARQNWMAKQATAIWRVAQLS
jgi:hypothetical protein